MYEDFNEIQLRQLEQMVNVIFRSLEDLETAIAVSLKRGEPLSKSEQAIAKQVYNMWNNNFAE